MRPVLEACTRRSPTTLSRNPYHILCLGRSIGSTPITDLCFEEGKIKQCRQQQIREHPVLSEGQKRSRNEAMLPAEDVHDMRKSSDIEQRRKGPKVYHIPLRGLRLSRVPLVREAAAVESGQIFQVEQFLFERCCVEAISCNRRQDPPIPP